MGVFTARQLAELLGYSRVGDLERKLIEQGIRPIYGRPGHFIVTQEQINASRGLGVSNVNDHVELI